MNPVDSNALELPIQDAVLKKKIALIINIELFIIIEKP